MYLNFEDRNQVKTFLIYFKHYLKVKLFIPKIYHVLLEKSRSGKQERLSIKLCFFIPAFIQTVSQSISLECHSCKTFSAFNHSGHLHQTLTNKSYLLQ